MNRRTFFSSLFAGAAALPALVKIVAEKPVDLEELPWEPSPDDSLAAANAIAEVYSRPMMEMIQNAPVYSDMFAQSVYR